MRNSTLPAVIAAALLLPTLLHAADLTEADSWPFVYPRDALHGGAMLDLRYLNETSAGAHGFITTTPDHPGFAFANGMPERFWGVNVQYALPPQQLALQAEFLAKIGVNMVRFHASINAKGEGTDIAEVDAKELDAIWHAVAVNKQRGIYSTISPYWANAGHMGGGAPASWGLEGVQPRQDLWGVLLFNPKLQAGYRAWVKALYTRVNPYTGIALAQDPAVAIIQVQNEDSLLFWTFDNLQPAQKKLLGAQFYQWALRRYGSTDAAFTRWEDAAVEQGDDLDQHVLGFYPLWKVSQSLPGGPGKRLADQLEFLARTQRDFYTGLESYFRNELHCRQLINASNWITADPVRLNDLERWTYSGNDVEAVNRYYDGRHEGPNSGWRIDPGDFFTDRSALLNPRAMPTNLKQMVGAPMIITESSWVAPLSYQSEGPFLMAAYQSLTGVAGFDWFVATAPEYDPQPFKLFANVHGQHPLGKWTCSIPAIEGNFPAAALMYRRGDLSPGETEVQEERTLGSMVARQIPAISEDPTFDPNHSGGHGQATPDANGAGGGAVDPLAFLAGAVRLSIGPKDAVQVAKDLSACIERAQSRVISSTGQVKLDYGVGLCTVDSPRAQGVCGFLRQAGGRFALSTCDIQSSNDYAAILVVSLDNQSLAQSRRVLVQVGTVSRPTGWATEAATLPADKDHPAVEGFKVVNTGQMPWRLADAHVRLTIGNKSLSQATLLDSAGFAQRRLPAGKTPSGITVTLPVETMYLVLQ